LAGSGALAEKRSAEGGFIKAFETYFLTPFHIFSLLLA
jgi:hypothetical protein